MRRPCENPFRRRRRHSRREAASGRELTAFRVASRSAFGARCAMTTEEQLVVFVIDDDKSVRRGLEDLLHSVDLRVESFPSPKDFLVQKRPDAPGCIVLDVRLPGQSGLEFQQTLMKENIRLPVIFISGHGDIPMSVRAIKSGAIEFLTKPVHEQDLLDAIHAGIKRDRALRLQERDIADLQARLSALTPREREVLPLRCRPGQQTNGRRPRLERTDGENPSQPDHAKDASEILDRPGSHGRQTGDYN